MTELQYVAVQFKTSARTYTYHNSGLPVEEGDFVKCPDPRGNPGDWIRGEVVRVLEAPPAFETKGILGIAPR